MRVRVRIRDLLFTKSHSSALVLLLFTGFGIIVGYQMDTNTSASQIHRPKLDPSHVSPTARLLSLSTFFFIHTTVRILICFLLSTTSQALSYLPRPTSCIQCQEIYRPRHTGIAYLTAKCLSRSKRCTLPRQAVSTYTSQQFK